MSPNSSHFGRMADVGFNTEVQDEQEQQILAEISFHIQRVCFLDLNRPCIVQRYRGKYCHYCVLP